MTSTEPADLSVPAPQPNPSAGDDFAAVDRYIAGREDASGIADELARRYGGSGRAVELPGTLGGDDRLPADDDAVPIVPSARVDLDLDQIEAAFTHLASTESGDCRDCVNAIEAGQALVAEVRRLRGELERHKAPTGDAEIDALLAKCKRNASSRGYRVAAYALRSLAAARAEAEDLRQAYRTVCDYAEQHDATRASLNEARAEAEHLKLTVAALGKDRQRRIAEAARVREALQAVRGMHLACMECEGNGRCGWCHCCDAPWPCATVRALDAALDGAE